MTGIKLWARCLATLYLGIALIGFVSFTDRPAQGDDVFLRGDVNTDGQISISDALMLRRWLFNGDRAPTCLDAADFSDTSAIDLTDAIYNLSFAFLGGKPPQAPFPNIGPDPTPDTLGCESYVVVQPMESDDILRIGDVAGSPGQKVRIPVIVSNSVDLEAFQVVLNYDPQVLEVADSQVASEAIPGSYFEAIGIKFGGFFTIRSITCWIAPGRE